MANDSQAHGTHGGVGGYIAVALILGVITYAEFAIVEYDIAFLSSTAVLWILMILSVAKFAMVILYFMHLKDDDAAYSGFFGSGLAIALSTFIIFVLLMTLPSSVSYFRAVSAPAATPAAHDAAAGHEAGHELSDTVLALIESEGYSRDLVRIMDSGPPKDQSLNLPPPEAPEGGWTIASDEPGAAAEAASEAQPADAAPAEEAEAQEEAEAAPAVDEPAVEDALGETPEELPAGPVWDPERGQQVYAANCAACHQPQGQGIPGAFPPLAGHAAVVATVDGGREYLIDVLLYGLQGPIEVEGQTYNGVMPAWGHLQDAEIADVLNFIVQLGGEDAGLPDGFEPITAEDVAVERDESLATQAVHEQREALELP